MMNKDEIFNRLLVSILGTDAVMQQAAFCRAPDPAISVLSWPPPCAVDYDV